jgi:peptidoglycan/xylan/chitin deacetylase (PgdA/CDA1 family)
MKTSAILLALICLSSCNSSPEVKKETVVDSSIADKKDVPSATIADVNTILSRKEVPVLCYHDIRNTKPGLYSVPVETFRNQMKLLSDSGYQTITPDQYYAYLATGAALPEKPVMITFDDNDEDHYTVGAPELEKYGFKGVFFIMRITLGKPRYMSKEQIKELSDKGHVIGSHTWDHNMVTKYTEEDWQKQVSETTEKLEEITGKKVEYFAYPFGLWKPFVIPELQKRNIKAAFQLTAKRDSLQPLYTIRRMIVPGDWDGKRMYKWMKVNFK